MSYLPSSIGRLLAAFTLSTLLLAPLRAEVVINEIMAAASDRLLQYDANSVPQVGSGPRWSQAAFDDSIWPSGTGPFGFGSITGVPTAIATNLQNAVQHLTPTTYFRKSFNVAPGIEARPEQVQLVVSYNDGFVAYLNGVEVARRNGGPAKKFIYHDQPAYNREAYAGTATIPTNANSETLNLGAASAVLTGGSNVLAIHLLNASATDATFYLKADLRIAGSPTVALVTFNDSWKFFAGVVEPSGNLFDPAQLGSGKQRILWGTLAFDAASWTSGPGPFGFGGVGVIGTNVQTRMFNLTPSLYQRIAFNVTASQAVDALPLKLLVGNDDGFVAYLNGVEIARRRVGLPNTFTPHEAVADGDLSAVATETIFLEAASKLLVSGTNVLAIQAHNYAVNSSDFLMKADLQTSASVSLVANNAPAWQFLAGTAEPIPDPTGEEEESFPEGPDANSDWIELYNSGPAAVSLQGWRLTDDATDTAKWVFPNVILPVGGYLVVVADGDDLTSNPGGYLHANFKLDRDGEFLALYDQGGNVISQIAPQFPPQAAFHGYARDGAGAWRYTDRSTPGAENAGNWFTGVAATPTVNLPGRFYTGSRSVTLSTTTPGAVVRYTTNGKEPTATSPIAPTPLTINTSTALRARAFATGLIPSATITHTYLLNQTAARQSLPAACLTGDEQQVFYRPFGVFAVVNNASNNYAGGIWSNHPNSGSLTPPDTAEDPALYNAPMQGGKPAERPLSFEILHTDATPDLRIGSYLRCAGSPYSRQRYILANQNSPTPNIISPWPSNATEKPQLNLFFRDDVGPSPLEYPLVPLSPIATYDNVRLRAGKNDITNPFVRDEYSRRLFVNMGQATVLGDFCNVYVNGVFKGFYNICQRPREPFFQETRDTKRKFDVRNIGVIVDGDTLDFNEMITFTRTHPMTALADYQALQQRVDVVNVADYLILNAHGAMWDWPHNNYVMDRERSTNGRWRFSVWDGEGIYGGGAGRNPTYNTFAADLVVGNPLTENPVVPARLLYYQLRNNPEWRLLFADRIQKHFFNNGALVEAKMQALFDTLRTRVQPIMQEVLGQTMSTFMNIWLNGQGDTSRYTLSDGTTGSITNCPTRRRVMFDGYIDDTQGGVFMQGQFRAQQLWPTTIAPTFNAASGNVTQNFALTLTNPNGTGTIFYTTDGSDPRAVGGAAQGLTYSGTAMAISQTTRVRARVRSTANVWSPVNEGVFTPPVGAPLIFSEVAFHPASAGATDGDEFEFLEIKNVGTGSVALAGMHFSAGIDFTFPSGATLAAGAFAVLAKNPAQFAARYPGVTVLGAYGPATSLNNAGETVTLADLNEATIFSVTYDDAAPWPIGADGGGFSLVPVNRNGFTSASDPLQWRASTNVHGSPGADDPFFIPPVVINELLANPSTPQGDRVELFNPGAQPAEIGGWWLSDSAATPKKFSIPAGTTIPAGGFVVLNEAQFNPTTGVGVSFEFSRTGGEDIVLSSANANGVLTGYTHKFTAFGAMPPDVSLGRYFDSANTELLVLQSALTLGAANSGPRVGPVVITELMYNFTGRADFVELRNISDAPVPLFDPANPANTWKVTGIDFTFPANITLQPRQIVIVYGPTSADPTPFHTQYGVPSAVLAFGSEFGNLANNGGELVALQMPAAPVAGQPLSYIEIDAVKFNDAAPWPTGAGSPDGFGPSLERINWRAFGNDVVNWRTSGNGGTPGALTPSTFTAWQSVNFTTAQLADANFGGASADPDSDNLSNFWEWALGRNPLAADAAGAITTDFLMDGGNGPFLTLRYRRNLGASGLELHVDAGSAPDAWTLDGSLPVGLPINNGDGTETLTRRDTLSPSGAAQRFIRLRAVGN